ncbi:MAG: quaternary amine ABC transporter ATP-binding protein [Kiloniellales bacterium]
MASSRVEAPGRPELPVVAAGGAAAGGTGERPVKLACKGLWKLFGSGAAALLTRHQGEPDDTALREAGLIPAVRDAALEVHSGEIFVIMGLSGSGKSTLVRCLSRLVEPTAGQVFFEGQDLLRASPRELIELRRHKMGMVFQHFALLPHLDVLENVAFPLEVQGVKRAAREARAREVIELVGLKGRERNFPRELSGGQQQRVGIARSLAVEPEVWFLDEPFSALDPLIRTHLQDELLELQRNLKKTIVFVSHDLDEALKLGTHIAIMEGGDIVQYGAPEEIVLNPANEYVREFVAHMNPLDVLRGASLMTPLGALRRSGDDILLDRAGQLRLTLDGGGAPAAVAIDGKPARLEVYREGEGAPSGETPTFIVAPTDLSLRAAIELRQMSGQTVLLVEDGRFVGLCGDEEIYRGILRQTGAAGAESTA